MAAKKTQRKAAARKTRAAVSPLPGAWPISKVETRRRDELTLNPANSRRHSDRQVDQIAASLERFGWTMPILVDEADVVRAGEGRILAAAKIGIESVPVVVARGWSEDMLRAYAIADNQLTIASDWNLDTLTGELAHLQGVGFDLEPLGFSDLELGKLLNSSGAKAEALAEADGMELPELREVVVSRPGDLWLLGGHRILCGDSTRADDVSRLMSSAKADCILADPPYGMGKEREGIANDNLYREKLDAFQLSWWKAARAHLRPNGSVYVWGNAPDLWRLWYVGGLSTDTELSVRNEIVWDKGHAIGMKSSSGHSYPVGSERCLFLMRGQQFLGNLNRDDYWEGWDPLRNWLVEQRTRAGWSTKDVKAIVGSYSVNHWFVRSQFEPITEDNYNKLRKAAAGRAFEPTYQELFAKVFPGLLASAEDHRKALTRKMRKGRTFFDNSHESMTDVWSYPRVKGEDRFGHATPKPVAMLGRALRSSLPEDGVVLDPFSGTGSVLIAAHVLGATCYALELEPAFVDVAVRRWQDAAGEPAILDGDERTFDAIAGAGAR